MNLVCFNIQIRQDAQGRYCLNDLHKAAIASGLDVERKNPSDFFRTDMAKNFTASLQKVDETTHNPVVTKEGRNGGTYAVRLLAQRYCGWLSSDFEVVVYSTFDQFAMSEQVRIAERQAARLEFPDMTQALLEHRTEIGKQIPIDATCRGNIALLKSGIRWNSAISLTTQSSHTTISECFLQ